MVESWRDGVACEKCWEEIESQRAMLDLCVKCGTQLPALPAQARIGDRRCGRCDDYAFSLARACGPYSGALREHILWLKSHPRIPARLRGLLSATLSRHIQLAECESIVPMPLHAERLAERTYNQAEVIAEAVSSLTGLRVDTASVVRIKKTERHRAGMGAKERARSLEQAFSIRAPRSVENRVVLVIDDVMTTGSTAHEISSTLLEAGARAVNVLTLAHAISVYH